MAFEREPIARDEPPRPDEILEDGFEDRDAGPPKDSLPCLLPRHPTSKRVGLMVRLKERNQPGREFVANASRHERIANQRGDALS